MNLISFSCRKNISCVNYLFFYLFVYSMESSGSRYISNEEYDREQKESKL